MVEYEGQEDCVVYVVWCVVYVIDGFGNVVYVVDVCVIEGYVGDQVGYQYLFVCMQVVWFQYGGFEVLVDQVDGMQCQFVVDWI